MKGIQKEALEFYFRQHSQLLSVSTQSDEERAIVAIAGKALRNSFDHAYGVGALNLISAYCSKGNIILGHIEAEDKSNEIPAVQQLLKGFGLKDCIYTIDALHCQKKL